MAWRADGTHIDIAVFKARSRRYRSVLYRLDGVDVELEGGSYNALVPFSRRPPNGDPTLRDQTRDPGIRGPLRPSTTLHT
jgi:hypothetical protein